MDLPAQKLLRNAKNTALDKGSKLLIIFKISLELLLLGTSKRRPVSANWTDVPKVDKK